MNTNYILEVLDELGDELMRINIEASLIQDKCIEDKDLLTYARYYVINRSATRISHLLQHIAGTIEEEQSRLSKIKSRLGDIESSIENEEWRLSGIKSKLGDIESSIEEEQLK